MQSVIRESVMGQLINRLSDGRLLPHPEQKPDFVVPPYLLRASGEHILRLPTEPSSAQMIGSASEKEAQKTKVEFTTSAPPSRASSSHSTPQAHTRSSTPVNDFDEGARQESDITLVGQAESRANQTASSPQKHHDTLTPRENALAELDQPETRFGPVKDEVGLVDWYGPDDPANPHNWPRGKKAFTVACIFLLTFASYGGSAIYTPAIPGVMEEFHVSEVVAVLGLSLYVAAYGIGSLLWSPLQEIPYFGRNSLYIFSQLLYFGFNIGCALSPNIGALLVFRFLAGFTCAPALSTGVATIADLVDNQMLPYIVGLWAMGAVCGPTLTPTIASFAVSAKGWRWSMWELVWLSAASLVFLSFVFPETQSANILRRRAARLRRLTKSAEVESESERESKQITKAQIAKTALLRPFQILAEPIVAFLSIYLGLVYGLFYLWFESFPLVFGDIYHFTLGQQSLPFLGFAVSAVITYTGYALYLRYHWQPRWERNGGLEPEVRLELALMTAPSIIISLLWFGWGSRPGVNVWVAIVGACVYFPGIYLAFQSILVYLSLAYGNNAASVNAANNLCRSVMAAAFPLFGRAFFVNLGIGPGSSLLAGLSALLLIPLFLLYKYGKRIRKMSKYAAPVDEVAPTSSDDVEKQGAHPRPQPDVAH